MSEVKRYHLYAGLDVHAFAKCEAVLKYCVEDEGVWVMYEDYARLKAELARLRASSFVTAVPVEQYERVVKAGDAVCESPYLWEDDPAVIAWRAAKEGKPSA